MIVRLRRWRQLLAMIGSASSVSSAVGDDWVGFVDGVDCSASSMASAVGDDCSASSMASLDGIILSREML